MKIVVDLGCFPHILPGGTVTESIPLLIERFQPDVLYGFDPYPEQLSENYTIGRTRVIVEPLAAWTADTTLDFDPRNVGSTVMREKNLWGEWRREEPPTVNAFDFPHWLKHGMEQVHPGHDWIVKMDIEGAEFPIVRVLIDQGVDRLVALLLVEWHDVVMEPQFRALKAELLASLHCPVEDWEE